MKPRRLAVAYFGSQAVATVGWWVLLAAVPASRDLFAVRGAPMATLGAFWPGDFFVVALGSAFVGVRPDSGWSAPIAWLVAGAMLYAALFTCSAAVMRIASPAGALLMLPAAAASVIAAIVLSTHAPYSGLSAR